jgi:hypothetical protein
VIPKGQRGLSRWKALRERPWVIRQDEEGVAELIAGGGYRQRQYTHEVIAEIYALLMARRRRGETGKPPWLDDQIYELVRRVCGWNE